MLTLYRHMNLALLQQYGSNAWRIHNFLLEQTAKNIEKAVEDLKQLRVEVNRHVQELGSTSCHRKVVIELIVVQG